MDLKQQQKCVECPSAKGSDREKKKVLSDANAKKECKTWVVHCTMARGQVGRWHSIKYTLCVHIHIPNIIMKTRY